MAGMTTLLTMIMIVSMVMMTTQSHQETTQRVRSMIAGIVNTANIRRLLLSVNGPILGPFFSLICIRRACDIYKLFRLCPPLIQRLKDWKP